MTRATILFLVLLRLAIGWHFGFEGLDKLRSDNWSSEVYLRESSGPLAPKFHSLAGDPLGERLTPLAPDRDGYENLPPRLAKEWQAWFDGFVKHYGLSEDQKERAETNFHQRESQTVTWLLTEKKKIDKPSPHGPSISAEKSIGEWLSEYGRLQKQARDLEATELPKAKDEYGKKNLVARIRELKDDANRIRSSLQRDLDAQAKEMREAVRSVLDEKQAEMKRYKDIARPRLLQRDLLGWSDFLVPVGLVVIGACLLLGLLTRTACVLGAGLLLSFYLAMPPLPGSPENPRAEGHYLVVNKNVVELLALLTLATTASGQWFGLDRGIHAWRTRRRPKITV